MTDLEMTKLCAEAMGWRVGKLASKAVCFKVSDCAVISSNDKGGDHVWDPLHDDAQAMALWKRFGAECEGNVETAKGEEGIWWVVKMCGQRGDLHKSAGDDLNRAIVECVAKMQEARTTSRNAG